MEENKINLISKLYDEIIYSSYSKDNDMEESIRDDERNGYLTSNELLVRGDYQPVWWYMDNESGREGFITNDGEVYSLNNNREYYLDAIEDFLGSEVLSYDLTEEERKKYKK